MLGLKRGEVRLVPHDASWKEAAQVKMRLLKEILGDTLIDVQHVGSTSIEGICAKPVIDVAAGVSSFDTVRERLTALQKAGFLFVRETQAPKEMFFTCGDEIVRTHYIHVVPYGGEEWDGYILFRDFLNLRPRLRREYEQLKISLANRYRHERQQYTSSKNIFVKETIRQAKAYRVLGSHIDVQVDRPLGSEHPNHPGMIYPVNYGYVPGVMSPDGEEQDVYVIGVSQPVETFSGTVVAVAHRRNDIEDKWVAAPDGMVLYEPEIRRLLSFQEQYFNTEYICLYRKEK